MSTPARRAARAATKAQPAEPTPTCRAEAVLAQVRQYERVALVLQGGGALGAYQCGVMEALESCGVQPHWVAGISIGSINAALIAGNTPGQRTAALRRFWETVTEPPVLPLLPWDHGAALGWIPEPLLAPLASLQGARSVLEGQRGFFLPRWPLFGTGPAQRCRNDQATSPRNTPVHIPPDPRRLGPAPGSCHVRRPHLTPTLSAPTGRRGRWRLAHASALAGRGHAMPRFSRPSPR